MHSFILYSKFHTWPKMTLITKLSAVSQSVFWVHGTICNCPHPPSRFYIRGLLRKDYTYICVQVDMAILGA